MIIEMLLNAIYGIMNTLLVIELPKMPEQAMSYIETAFDYISAGAGILANYVYIDYLLILFFLLVAVDAGIMIYHFVMWIIKKIPMLGMS